MKSLFFTMTNQNTKENINYLRSGFEHRGLLRYRLVMGGMPLNADWTQVVADHDGKYNIYSEATQALMEAWSVHHKSEGSPSLLTPENYSPTKWSRGQFGMYQREYNAVFGQECESFSQKSGIIQSGLNTMQTTCVLQLEFSSDPAANNTIVRTPMGPEACITYDDRAVYELRAYIMYDKVIAFDETSGSIRAEY
jgi:hypothetical protein